ncbi:MAG: recombination regulator RecX [Gammaproteobacteria bacterium]|nr:recombination regulator RecX [Gammaproteobacteria bacterium]MDH3406998.1 recombination regulator RecX [Gammaproteobacteria bacterium]MDH3563069.1 recombination regulator RecX [Gammaproteobacteria bacterium]MDH5487515.1 recombination regulator RecX [Gammaproteobacteria bacterium]
MQWLARREHSQCELQRKLQNKGCDAVLASEVVSKLASERLVSDDRFMESLIQARRNRGYGPLHIQKELQEKGVAPEVIAQGLDVASQSWLEDIRRVQRKKFGGKIPKSYTERARQARFLQYRGFTYDQIQQLLNPRERE